MRNRMRNKADDPLLLARFPEDARFRAKMDEAKPSGKPDSRKFGVLTSYIKPLPPQTIFRPEDRQSESRKNIYIIEYRSEEPADYYRSINRNQI